MTEICRKCPAKIPLLKMDGNVRKAVAIRLKLFLEQEEKSYLHWLQHIKSRLPATRAKMLERNYLKRIQSYKIVIHTITPARERDGDMPNLYVARKDLPKVEPVLTPENSKPFF